MKIVEDKKQLDSELLYLEEKIKASEKELESLRKDITATQMQLRVIE